MCCDIIKDSQNVVIDHLEVVTREEYVRQFFIINNYYVAVQLVQTVQLACNLSSKLGQKI